MPDILMNILFIQADFSFPVLIKKISTRGSPDTRHWVKTYNLMFRYDNQDVDEWYMTEGEQKMVGTNISCKYYMVLQHLDMLIDACCTFR